MSTQLDRIAEPAALLNVESGEVLPATVENAAACLIACRNMKERVNDLVTETTAFLIAEAERRGTKTLHSETETIALSGGVGFEYDAQDLMELLRSAGCPEDRIEAAVTAEITYKVNRSVLKQLEVNKDYKAAIDLARHEVERPMRAAVKRRNA